MKRLIVSLVIGIGSLAACAQSICYGYGPPAGSCVSTFLWSDVPQANTLLWSESFAGATIPANWAVTGSGTWTLSNGLISPSTNQGYGTILALSRYFNLEQRTIRISFQILTSGAVMGFGTVDSANAYADGPSLFTVDSGANTLNIGNAYVPGANPGVVASVPLGFAVTTGKTYILSISQSFRQVTATITDPSSGIVASVSDGNNVTDGGIIPSWGKLNDYPGFVAVAGQFEINNMTITANAKQPQVMFLGDSITWGVGLTIQQTWASIVGSQVPKVSYLVSGRPGATSYGVLGRITSELQYVLPKYVVILIGTNDSALVSLANYEANMTAIVSQAESYGAQVVICTVPPNGAGQAEINAENAFLLGLTGVTFVRFDQALSIGGDGMTQNTALFQADHTHPTAAGAGLMAQQFRINAPFLFN